MSKNLLLIHGAFCTNTSFNYLIDKFSDEYEITYFEYDVRDGFYNILEAMKRELKEDNRPYNIISHSMGGLYALYLHNYINTQKSISVSTPFGGSEYADSIRYFFNSNRLLKDISTHSKVVREVPNIHISVPWLQIVTTKGDTPWMKQPNDTVVSRNSMCAIKNVDYKYLEYTHTEVLLAEETMDTIRNFLNEGSSE